MDIHAARLPVLFSGSEHRTRLLASVGGSAYEPVDGAVPLLGVPSCINKLVLWQGKVPIRFLRIFGKRFRRSSECCTVDCGGLPRRAPPAEGFLSSFKVRMCVCVCFVGF